ncbi:MAG: glycoside hydrolase family 5 protein [Prevotella sp.]|nr:glycoside hydrolase family 5 protein [Prevotella sp.]
MKKNLLIGTAWLAAFVLTTGRTFAQDFESASEAVANMRVGWNLGNTLDSNSGDLDNMWIETWTDCSPNAYETAWGQPATTKALIKMFRDAGFGAIRVPVTWYPHIDDNGAVDEKWMARVKEVVDYVIDLGLYCILNVHHDTGSANTAWLRASGTTYTGTKTKFEALWTNIANEFKDYGEKLLFEGYNEMLDDYSSWCFASFGTSSGYDASVASDAYSAINNYAQSFVNAVRATGGNNAVRNLVVNTYGGCDGDGTWSSHLSDPLTNLNYPEDNVSDHIAFEVHYYPTISDLSTSISGAQQCFGSIKTNLMSKGAPVIIGECGTLDDTAYNTNRDVMLEFTKEYIALAKEYGMAAFYWMTLSDASDRSVPQWTTEDLKDAIITGYYGDEGFTYEGEDEDDDIDSDGNVEENGGDVEDNNGDVDENNGDDNSDGNVEDNNGNVDDDTNGIKNVSSDDSNEPVYNMQGVRVDDMSKKGLYIKGGKKYIVR